MEVPVIRSCAVVLSLLGCGSLLAGENVWTTNGPAGVVTALAVDPNAAVIYTGSTVEGRSLAFRSLDHGANWMVIAEAPQTTSISGFTVDTGQSETVSASATNGGLLGSTGIYQSRDAGETWVLVATLSSTDVLALAAQPTRPNILFAVGRKWRCFQAPCFPYSTLGAAIVRSVDSGRNWTDVTVGIPRTGAVVAVAFDPTDPNRIYAAGDAGVLVSQDGGDHWELSVTGMGDCRSVRALGVDTRNPGVILAGTTWRDSQPYACGGVFLSRDFGRTWAATSLRGRDVSALAIDPRSSNILYVGVATSNPVYPEVGVFRSTDGGATWGRFGSGLPQSGVRGLVVEPSGRFLHAATGMGVFDYEIVPGARPPVVPGWDRGETRSVPSRP